MLTCPYCGHRFPLTFARYFKAGPGRYTCPQCEAESLLVLPPWLKIVERSVLIPGAVAAGVLCVFHLLYGLLLMAGWLAVNVPLNVFLDSRYGTLQSTAVPPRLPPPLPPQP